MRAAKAVLGTISRSPNAVQRSSLVQEAARLLRIPGSALQDDLRYMMRRARRGSSFSPAGKSAGPSESTENAAPAEETALCEHMAHITDTPELAELVNEYLPLEMLSNSFCRKFVEASLKSLKTGQPLHEIVNAEDDSSREFQRFAVSVLEAPSKIKGVEFSRESAVKDLILYLWRLRLKQDRFDLRRKAESSPDINVRQKLQEITYNLKALKKWQDGSAVIGIYLAENE